MPACDAQEVIIREKLQKLEARLTEREDTAERIREQIKLATGQLGGVRVATSVACNAFLGCGSGVGDGVGLQPLLVFVGFIARFMSASIGRNPPGCLCVRVFACVHVVADQFISATSQRVVTTRVTATTQARRRTTDHLVAERGYSTSHTEKVCGCGLACLRCFVLPALCVSPTHRMPMGCVCALYSHRALCGACCVVGDTLGGAQPHLSAPASTMFRGKFEAAATAGGGAASTSGGTASGT